MLPKFPLRFYIPGAQAQDSSKRKNDLVHCFSWVSFKVSLFIFIYLKSKQSRFWSLYKIESLKIRCILYSKGLTTSQTHFSLKLSIGNVFNINHFFWQNTTKVTSIVLVVVMDFLGDWKTYPARGHWELI